jgi:hypothetical protein
MHLIFRSSLPDPQSQNHRNSAAIPVVLLNRIRQIRPESERLNATVIPLQTLCLFRAEGVEGENVIRLSGVETAVASFSGRTIRKYNRRLRKQNPPAYPRGDDLFGGKEKGVYAAA